MYKSTKHIVTFAMIFALSLPALSASAQIGTTVGSSTRQQERQEARTQAKEKLTSQQGERIKERSNREIDRRITALKSSIDRVNEMKRVGDSTKTSLTNSLQAEITILEQLKTKIAGETDIETLRTDAQSITKSYRVFQLVIPKTQIVAAVDRVLNIVQDMAKVTTKLETRIMEAQTAGNDVSKLNASLTDMKAKIVDANVQATSAIGMVDPLVPDNGDKTLMEANKTTLKNAREKIKAAREDIVQAHKDAQTIQKALRTMKPKSAASSTSATTTTTP
jgi:hypothetical protein